MSKIIEKGVQGMEKKSAMFFNRYDLLEHTDRKKARYLLESLNKHLYAKQTNKYVEIEYKGNTIKQLRVILEFDIDEAIECIKSVSDDRELFNSRREFHLEILERVKERKINFKKK